MEAQHKFPYRWRLADLKPAAQDAPTVFGTFICGGGSTMGYKLAGFHHLGGVEIDPKIADVYRRNHHPERLYVEDLRAFNKRDDLPDELYRLDLLDGSPPCSTFSMAGSREAAWGVKKTFREGQAKQTLDDLVFVYCDTIAKLRPKAAILENVSGLVKGNARAYVNQILRRLDAAGYEAQIFLLNAATMGVPQTRQRTYIIARRKDLALPPLTLKVNEPPIVFGEIWDCDDTSENLTDREKKLWLKRRPADSGLDDIASREIGKAIYFNTRLVYADKVCSTNTATMAHILYDVPRHLNNQELLLAASYPTDYNCPEQLVQFITGMSVAPVQMAHIASTIKTQWLTQ